MRVHDCEVFAETGHCEHRFWVEVEPGVRVSWTDLFGMDPDFTPRRPWWRRALDWLASA